jgi:hypothetical protein
MSLLITAYKLHSRLRKGKKDMWYVSHTVQNKRS